MEVKFKRLSDLAKTPTYGSEKAAACDLYAAIDTPLTIAPHTTEKVPTDIAVALPDFTFGAVFARSGLATKQSLRPANCVGIVDADYRGNIFIPLHNDSDMPQLIAPHERIAQFVLMPYMMMDFQEVEELDDTERSDKGFGSTGQF